MLDYWGYQRYVEAETKNIVQLELEWRKDDVWPTELAGCMARRGFYRYARGLLQCQYYCWHSDLRQFSADELARMGLTFESGGARNAGTGNGCFPQERWPALFTSLWWTWYLLRRAVGCPRRNHANVRSPRTRAGRELCPWCEGPVTGECDSCDRKACGRHLFQLLEED